MSTKLAKGNRLALPGNHDIIVDASSPDTHDTIIICINPYKHHSNILTTITMAPTAQLTSTAANTLPQPAHQTGSHSIAAREEYRGHNRGHI